MKVRVVEISGLSSYGEVNKAFAVEYKRHFWSKWVNFYQTGYVGSDEEYNLKRDLKRCTTLAKALEERGETLIKTVVNYETDN